MLVRAQRSIALVLGLFGCELDVKDKESDSRTEIAEQKPTSAHTNPKICTTK
jgi:hypothetical protein